MSDHPAVQRDGKHRLRSLLVSVCLLSLFYVLSTGPVIKLLGTPRPVQMIYAPLRLLGDTFPDVEGVFDWYLEDVWHVH